MKVGPSLAKALVAGLVLIAAANAVVLAGVAYNRSGEPQGVLRLTERELQIRNWAWPANENSSVDVHLEWRVRQVDSSDDEFRGRWYRGVRWLRLAQLREFGFDVANDIDAEETADHVARQPSRRVWLVLENDGPAYQAALERARRNVERAASLAKVNADDIAIRERLTAAQRAVEREERLATRLFVVDVGLDKEALRVRYADRKQYVVVSGRLGVAIEGQPGERRLIAHVIGIDVEAIRVPHAYRAIVEPFARSDRYADIREPRFAATVNFGRRFEPWMAELALLKQSQ